MRGHNNGDWTMTKMIDRMSTAGVMMLAFAPLAIAVAFIG
jgi:hypothetical protein